MNKKVLVSILAMTSASTMTAWADANVDKLKTDNLEDWKKGSEGSDLELEGGVIVSPVGADIVKTINLAPGTYRLVAGTLTNAKILFGKTELTKVEGKDYYTFKVTGDAPTDSTLTFKAVNQGESRIGGLTLTLMYDFDADRKVLERQLTDLINTLQKGDSKYEELTLESSRISAKIAQLEDGADKAYDAYVDYKMYLGVANCTLQKDLAEFENQVNHQANNKKAYDAAISLINAQINALNEAKDKLDGYSNENGLSDYAKGITSKRLNEAETAINEAKTQAETAHKDGSAATVLGEDWTKKFNETVPALVEAFAKAVAAAPADHNAYLTINTRIAALKTLEENAVQEILKELTDKDAEGKEVYTDSRDEAQEKLGKVLVDITSIESKKGDDTNHEGVSKLYSDNVDKLKQGGTFEVRIIEIRDEWIEFAQKHKDAYANAKESVNKLQGDLEDIKKDLGFTIAWNERIQEVQNLIKAHTQTIEADNKAHRIGDQTYDYTDVTDAIKDLKEKSEADIHKYKAYQEAKTAIADAQTTLTKAIDAVSKLTSEKVEGYSTSGKYTKIEGDLQTKLKGISEQLEEDYKDKNKKVESDYTAEFLTEVENYQNAAELALKDYEEITEVLTGYNASLNMLRETVLDRDVTVGDGNVTYGSRIDAIQEIITKIENSFDNAKNATDDAYNEGLSTTQKMLSEGANIADEVGSLCESYPTDKANYDNEIVSAAIERVLAEATALVDKSKQSLKAIKGQFEGLNLDLETVKTAKEKLDSLNGVILEQETFINNVNSNTSNKAEVLAALQKVNTTLNETSGEIDALAKLVDECWDHNDANSAKWKELTNEDGGRLTTLYTKIQKISTKDENKKVIFEGKRNGYLDQYTSLSSDIEESYEAETLVENWEDKTVEEETEKGFDSQISELEDSVDKALKDATDSDTNWDAYNETKKYSDDKKIAKKIEDAQDNLNGDWAQYVDDDAKAHYTDVLNGYSEDNGNILKAIEDAYGNGTSDTEQENLQGQINTLLDKVNAVGTEIQQNYGSYVNLCTTYGNVSAAWTSVYAHISEADNSSKKEDYLKQLRDLKAQLVDAKSAIDQNYKNGVYGSENQASIDNEKLTSLEAQINKLSKTQSDGYIAQIEIDNANRHEAFNSALTAARTYWSAAVDTIGRYSSLTNEELRKVATGATQEANQKLNVILTLMNDTAKAESKKYQETVAPALFDKEQTFKKAVEEKRAEIQQTLDVLDDAVSSKAKELLTANLTDAQDALDATRVAIEGITSDDNKEAIIKKAASDYKKAEDIIVAAQKASEGNDFALVVDTHLTALGTVEGLLASAKEQAAAWEWERFSSDVTTTKANQESDLDKYTYLADNERDFVNEYAKAWAGETEETNKLDSLKGKANEYEQAKTLFDNVRTLKENLNDVAKAATAIYEAAQKAAGLYDKNLEAYNVLFAQAKDLQADLDKAKAYVDAFGCSYLLPTLVSSVQDDLNSVFDNLEYQKQYGGCTDDKYKVETDGKTTYEVDKDKSIASAINNIYGTSYVQELVWLKSQVLDLDGEYNKAYAANSTAAEGLEADKNGLQDKVENYSFAVESEGGTQDGLELKSNETIQNELLGFELEISSLRSELVKIYNAELEHNTIVDLNGKLGVVKGSYDEKKGKLEGKCSEDNETWQALLAVGESIDDIQSRIAGYSTKPGQILLNQPAIEKAISEVKTELEGLTGKINELVAKYEANEAAYKELSRKLDDDVAELEAAETAIMALTTIDRDEAANGISGIRTDIEEEETDLDSLHTQVMLTSGSTVKDFSDDIATLLKTYTFKENSNLIDTLQTAINDIQTALPSNVMNRDSLKNEIIALETSAQNLCDYNNDAEDGKVTCDIDGTVIVEDSVDYVNVASPSINTRRGELNETLAALKQTIKANTYVVGDADGDGNVQVTDYMKVMKLVLGTESVEEGTVNFLRADANQDGKINNGDLVAVVNKILGIRTVDALEQVLATNSMESVGEVKMAAVEGVASKKIAIQLSSTNKYAACQMDVNIPAGVTVTSSSIEGLQNHSLYSAEQTDGTLRLVVSSLENAVMDTEGNATIYLEVEGNNAEAITVSNVTAADVAGATYNIVDKGEATGINGVVSNANSGSLKQRIYSVGGQMMDGVKKGINIIMNSDGTARKVLKK